MATTVASTTSAITDVAKSMLGTIKKAIVKGFVKIQEGQIRRARRMIENKTYPF